MGLLPPHPLLFLQPHQLRIQRIPHLPCTQLNPPLPCIQPLVRRLLSPPTVHPLLILLKPLLPLSLQSHVKPRETSARKILTAVGGNVTRKRTFARSKRKTDACFVFVF